MFWGDCKGQTALFFRVPSPKTPRPGVSPLRALVPFFIEEIGNCLVVQREAYLEASTALQVTTNMT